MLQKKFLGVMLFSAIFASQSLSAATAPLDKMPFHI
jgi:hypothetical protein